MHECSREKENLSGSKGSLGQGQESGCKMNPEIYGTLASLNESLQIVSRSLDVLQAAELLTPQVTELHRLTAEQLRAEVSQSITINLHTREAETAFQVQQERLRLEKQQQEG